MNLCDGDGGYGGTHKDHKLGLVQRVTGYCRVSTRQLRHYANLPTAVLLISLLITSINLHETRQFSHKLSQGSSVSQRREALSAPTLIKRQAWIKAQRLESGYLKHVTGVLTSAGYSLDGGTYSDWDLMWSHEYPFGDVKLKKILMQLKPHQKVNKWPGSGYVTSKVSLATSAIKHVPKAFDLPSKEPEFKEYAAEHPDAMWVQKSNKHRGIRITPVSGLDLSSSNTFVQQYVDKPLIIDKKKFDIGIYTVITSIEPLRIYIIDHEILLRFCGKDYHPFDASDINKYVVTDEYTPIWDIPSLNKYFDLGFSSKQSLRQYLKDEGRPADGIFEDIESTIRDVYLSKLSKIREAVKAYNHGNFFEMVRFDFVLDEDLKLYLMEVNMSPNLSSGHFAANRLLYEQVVYNLLHLVGAVGRVNHVSKADTNEQEMLAGPKDLSVEPTQCLKQCDQGCRPVECKLCYSCMTTNQKAMIQEAYREHLNKRTTKRVMPPTLDYDNPDVKPEYWENLSGIDKTMHLWFAGKCKLDRTWC